MKKMSGLEYLNATLAAMKARALAMAQAKALKPVNRTEADLPIDEIDGMLAYES
jgi:hypothetical protein